MDIVIELGKFLISTAVLGGLIVWLFKEYIKMKFSKEIEKHKGEIDDYFHKKKLKFSKLHEERALVIKGLYSKLSKYHKSLKSNLQDVENASNIDWKLKKIRIDETFEIGNDFSDYYDQNKILLAPELCHQIEKLKESHFNSLKSITISHILASDNNSSLSVDERASQYLECEINLKHLLDVEILNIELNLEAEFRQILGVIE